jgi:hypothetical protein
MTERELDAIKHRLDNAQKNLRQLWYEELKHNGWRFGEYPFSCFLKERTESLDDQANT